jgi:hypothetical protein
VRCSRRALSLAALAALSGARRALAAPPSAARWSVMVYMAGDNNLEGLIVKDFENELAAVGSTPAVQVVALADRKPGRDRSRDNWKGVKLFHVEKGMRATPENAVASWGERDMGNAKTLVDFVDWTRANYPADRYALFFWGHSWSWHPGVTMWDSTSHDALNPREIRSAQPQLGFIDVIGYDSCNAGSIETEALWRGHAAAIAHSQEWVDVHGFAYDQILAALNDDPGMSAGDLAVVASRGAAAQERTWSAVALDQRWDVLESAVDAWSKALAAGLPAHRDDYRAALAATQHFVDAPMDRDLSDLAAQINARVDDPAIRGAGQAVIDAVAGAVLAEQHRSNYPGAHGITIFVPGHTRGRAFAAYRNLDFAANTGWDEFLRQWR